MSSRLFLTTFLFSLPAASYASVYVSDFSGASAGDPLPGVDFWTQNQVNPTGPTSPLTWVAPIGSSLGGAIGGYYDAPGSDPLTASRPVGVLFGGSDLSMRFAIQDSTTDYAYRNDFSIRVASGLGVNLFSLDFKATSQGGLFDSPAAPNDPGTSDALWNVSWSSIGAAPMGAFGAVGEDSLYVMDVSFTPNGADMDFELTLSGAAGAPVVESGTLTGLGSEIFGQIQVSFSQGSGVDYGDNFIVFEGVPEPSVWALVMFSAGGLLVRRRRSS